MNRIKNVLEYLETSEKLYPDKIAFADETSAVTYSQFAAAARRTGTAIARLTAPGRPVAVLGEKSVETLIAFFGCVYAGCFYVPLNPRHPAERIEKILCSLGFPAIWAQEKYISLLPQQSAEQNLIRSGDGTPDADEALLGQIRGRSTDADPLYIMFTSGSTGTPKGIAVSHRSVIDFIEEFSKLFDITCDDVIGNQAPFDFDVSVKDVYSTLRNGATMQIIPKKLFSFPVMLTDFLIDRKVTVLIWAVSALCILSTFRSFSYKVPYPVKKVLFSGEAMPVVQLNEWKKYLPDAMFVNLYGPTEITCNCTYYILGKGPYTDGVLPIGKPFPNERVFLLSEDGKAIEEEGVTGEICVSGTALALGYYNNAQATAAAFVQNPLNSVYPETIYKTGDLAYYRADGNLCFVGRKDFQIKYQGHRIELSEIESAMQSIEGVERAVCLFDGKAERIVAFYKGKVGQSDIKVALRKRLPSYMVPHSCVAVDGFELTENGKTDRRKLMEKLNYA